jgi:hypothetical protein
MHPPDMFVPLRDGVPWCQELETSGTGAGASPEPDFPMFYLRDRVLNQRDWFWSKRGKSSTLDYAYESIIRVVLAGALVVAAMHLVTLLTQPAGQHLALRRVIEILAITLPAIGSAASALQSMLQGRRLSRSYKLHAQELDLLRDELERLIGAKPVGIAAFEHQLKRIVLRTEELLSNELRVWYFIVRPL